MQTKLLLADEEAVCLAASLLKKGQLVGMPTETVYGLAADAQNSAAVKKIFAAKGRPQDNPLIVHIGSMGMLPLVACQIPKEAFVLAEKFWPGPLTIVLPKTANIAAQVSAGLGTVGVRMPQHPVALAIIKKSGLALAAPSANSSGRPSPTTAAHVFEDMQGRIPLIVDGGVAEVGVESTVVSLLPRPVLLRPGFVTKQQIEAAIGQKVEIAAAVKAPLTAGQQPQSPGMKYRHYAPKAQLVLVQGSPAAFAKHLQNLQDKTGVWALCFNGEGGGLPLPFICYGEERDSAAQAKALFAALRSLDVQGAKTVYVHLAANKSGIGLAVYNRLLRAAAFRVIKV